MSREIFNRPFLKVLQPSSMGNIFHGKRNSHFNNISYFHSISYLFLNRKNKVLTHMSQPLVKFMFLAPYLPLCCHSESWVLKLFHYILIDMFQELKTEEDRTCRVPFPPLLFTTMLVNVISFIHFLSLWSLTPSQTFWELWNPPRIMYVRFSNAHRSEKKKFTHLPKEWIFPRTAGFLIIHQS